VLSDGLARVQDHRGDLPLGDPDLDTPASEHRGNGVVVPIYPDQRLLRNPQHPAAIRIDRHHAERPLLTLLGQPLGRDTTDRAMRSTGAPLGVGVFDVTID
jgi:hypothetical protein